MPVYDEEKTCAPGEHDSLGKSQQERAKEIADLEALYNEPSAEKNDKSLAEQEANTPDDSLGAGYTGVGPAKDNKSKGLLSKFTSTRAKLLGFGAGAGRNQPQPLQHILDQSLPVVQNYRDGPATCRRTMPRTIAQHAPCQAGRLRCASILQTPVHNLRRCRG